MGGVEEVEGINIIFYLGPEAVDAHSERGWFWLVCAFPEEARYRNTRGEAYIILYEGVCSVNV